MCICLVECGQHSFLVLPTTSRSYHLSVPPSVVTPEPFGERCDMYIPFRAEPWVQIIDFFYPHRKQLEKYRKYWRLTGTQRRILAKKTAEDMRRPASVKRGVQTWKLRLFQKAILMPRLFSTCESGIPESRESSVVLSGSLNWEGLPHPCLRCHGMVVKLCLSDKMWCSVLNVTLAWPEITWEASLSEGLSRSCRLRTCLCNCGNQYGKTQLKGEAPLSSVGPWTF